LAHGFSPWPADFIAIRPVRGRAPPSWQKGVAKEAAISSESESREGDQQGTQKDAVPKHIFPVISSSYAHLQKFPSPHESISGLNC
jgi:hypothetical protein